MRSTSASRAGFLGAVVALICACAPGGGGTTDVLSADSIADVGSNDAPDSGDARSDGAAGDSSMDGTADAAVADACAERPADASATTRCVRAVRGRVTDTSDRAMPMVPVTFCGPACFFGRAGADGAFEIRPDDFIDVTLYSVQGHGRPDHASAFVPIDQIMPNAAGDVVLPAPIRLPRYEVTGPILPMTGDGMTYRAGDVAITIPAGARIEFDLEDAELGDLGRRLRVAFVPIDRAAPFASSAGLTAVWALGPFNLISDRDLSVEVANRGMLPPGSAVDFVVMGNRILDPPYDSGEPVVAATGVVSSDGMTIRTSTGAGVRWLTWLGVRPRR